jgi:hypothetical protein
MEELAAEFGLEKVDEARPLVRKVGWKTRETEAEREYWQTCDKPTARFFIEANPGYVEGDGLVTVVPVTASNLLTMFRNVGERKLRAPVEAALSLVRWLPLGARLSRSEIVRQLKAAPLFSQFDESTLKAVAGRAKIVQLPAGRSVFRQGDASNELYLLARGAACRSWLRQGEHRELAPRQALTVEPGTHVLLLSGTVELAHAGPQVAAHGVLLLEAEHPLRWVAQETARIVLLPRGAVPTRGASLAKAA